MESMPKKRVCITLPEGLVEWLDKQVDSRTYADRSHAIEMAIIALKEKKGS
jgi:metal-responsive CopG/Arc/MetJ family transcriptional regulator